MYNTKKKGGGVQNRKNLILIFKTKHLQFKIKLFIFAKLKRSYLFLKSSECS